MNILFTILGIIDIAAAALIFYPIFEMILPYVMIFMLAKGVYTLMIGLASRSMGSHCVLLCISDVLVGVALGAMVMGYGTIASAGLIGSFIKSVGMVGIVKGLYTTALPLFS
jgi:hypothetical protein